MSINPITLVDVYKFGHRRQYPDGTTRVYSNFTPRSSRVLGQNEVVFFGLQYFLQRYLIDDVREDFFGLEKEYVLDKYQQRTESVLGKNNVGTDHIEALHDLGYFPLEFRALPEGTLCPLRVPMLTVENTHDDFFWLPNYIETLMSATLWMPCTSATTAYRLRTLLNQACEKTGGDPNFVQWQGHDFSMRGMAGLEAACLSGAGHLLSFSGTDTVPAIDFIETYYRNAEPGLIGASVPATEHSVMSAGGEDDEIGTFERLLALYPQGIVSIVSDTWDLWAVLTKILPALKDRIKARYGKVVIRPDSGNPADILCGDPKAKPFDPARFGVIQLLWEVFGGTTNSNGFKVLDPHIGAIYGDSIAYERAQEITQRLAANGFASTNIVFGVGSFSYQYATRDTYGFAMKATWARVNGEGRDLFKNPKTDDGVKKSARGRLSVVKDWNGKLAVNEQVTPTQEAMSLLQPVWRDGAFIRRQSFNEVRKTLWGNA